MKDWKRFGILSRQLLSSFAFMKKVRSERLRTVLLVDPITLFAQAAISTFERFINSFLEKRDPSKASEDKIEKSMLGSLAEVTEAMIRMFVMWTMGTMMMIRRRMYQTDTRCSSLSAISSLRACAEHATTGVTTEEEDKEMYRIEQVQLWLSILGLLLKLGSDKRENVRNESIKVLFDILIENENTQQRFNDKMGIVIQSFIFPYMEQVEQTTFESVAEGSKSTQQWLSTWLTVFDGACKLIQTVFTAHIQDQETDLTDDLEETWKTFIARLVFAFECRSELIIRSAVCSISIMVKSMSKIFPRYRTPAVLSS
eukprot:752030-Hanusia_phi.AAC.5